MRTGGWQQNVAAGLYPFFRLPDAPIDIQYPGGLLASRFVRSCRRCGPSCRRQPCQANVPPCKIRVWSWWWASA